MEPLLRVRTNRFEFTIRGPLENRRGPLSGQERPRPAFLSVRAEGDRNAVEVVWLDQHGAVQRETPEIGPWLFEETDYEIALEMLDGSCDASIGHRSPTVQQRFAPVPRHSEIVLGTINFRQQVGRTDFALCASGTLLARVTVEIFPTKLDYDTDYQRMVGELGELERALCLEFMRATEAPGDVVRSDDQRGLEWALLLQNIMPRLQAAMGYVDRRPTRKLTATTEDLRAERVKRVDTRLRSAIRHGAGRGGALRVAGIWMKEWLPALVARESLDTNEHRWLKARLKTARDRIRALIIVTTADLREREQAGNAVGKARRKLDALNELGADVDRLLRTSVLDEASQAPPKNFSSQLMSSGLGYREATRALLELNYGIVPGCGSFDSFPMKDLDVLYEMWCFLTLVQLVSKSARAEVDVSGIVAIGERGLSIYLRRGRASRVLLLGAVRIEMQYSPRFDGPTGDQYPDIVMTIHFDDAPSVVVVFDAKYRIDASAQYVARFGCPGPPVDAVNALHRYRDAIVVYERGRPRRPVAKGIAVFPGDRASWDGFQASPLVSSIEQLGIGALPMLPGNTAPVEGWLDVFFSQPYSRMAYAGPTSVGGAPLQ